jgi:hypothetical protein
MSTLPLLARECWIVLMMQAWEAVRTSPWLQPSQNDHQLLHTLLFMHCTDATASIVRWLHVNRLHRAGMQTSLLRATLLCAALLP